MREQVSIGKALKSVQVGEFASQSAVLRVQLEWMDVRRLMQYAAASKRTIREWIHSSENPLPAVQVKRKLYVSRIEFDRWFEAHQYRPAGKLDLNHLVDEVMVELGEKR